MKPYQVWFLNDQGSVVRGYSLSWNTIEEALEFGYEKLMRTDFSKGQLKCNRELVLYFSIPPIIPKYPLICPSCGRVSIRIRPGVCTCRRCDFQDSMDGFNVIVPFKEVMK